MNNDPRLFIKRDPATRMYRVYWGRTHHTMLDYYATPSTANDAAKRMIRSHR